MGHILECWMVVLLAVTGWCGAGERICADSMGYCQSVNTTMCHSSEDLSQSYKDNMICVYKKCKPYYPPQWSFLDKKSGVLGWSCRKSCNMCNIPTSGAVYDSQERALIEFYHATNGPSWEDPYDTTLDANSWLNSSVGHCGWPGVICDADGNVTHL